MGGAVSNSGPIEIEILDRPLGSLGSNNDDNVIYIVTKSELMDASQNIKKAAEWRSLSEDFNVEPRQPSEEQKVKDQKSLRNCREKKKAVDALKVRMMKTLKEKSIPTLEANIKQLQQEQALLAQQYQQQLQQNYGSPTQTQQPQSQAQPQQQAQVMQSGASAGAQTIRVSQQQPQVIQLQPQQQQQQQQAQAHHQMQQPGAVAGPPGGIQIITPTREIYQIPVQLNAQQLQVLRAQMVGGAGSSQPIVIHTAPIQIQLAQPAQTVQTVQLQGGQHMYNIQQQY